MTLRDVFTEMNLTPYDLNVDMLDVHAVRTEADSAYNALLDGLLSTRANVNTTKDDNLAMVLVIFACYGESLRYNSSSIFAVLDAPITW